MKLVLHIMHGLMQIGMIIRVHGLLLLLKLHRLLLHHWLLTVLHWHLTWLHVLDLSAILNGHLDLLLLSGGASWRARVPTAADARSCKHAVINRRSGTPAPCTGLFFSCGADPLDLPPFPPPPPSRSPDLWPLNYSLVARPACTPLDSP